MGHGDQVDEIPLDQNPDQRNRAYTQPGQPSGYSQSYPQPGAQPGGYPPQGQPQQGGYPPQNQSGYPPQGGYPPQQGGYPPQQGGYPPQGGYPQYPPQGGYPPQQYPQQGYPPQSYPPSGSSPIVINQVQSQQQQQSQPVVVGPSVYFAGRQYGDDLTPSLIVFIVGWFCCCVWAAGFKFIKSKNAAAKMLGIASVVLFFLSFIGLIVGIAVGVAGAAAAASALSGSYSTSYYLTVYASASYNYDYIPSGTSYVKLTASGSWRACGSCTYYDADGGSGSCGSSCLVSSAPQMRLVARCGSYGTWTSIGDEGTITCSGEYLYVAANDDTSRSFNEGYMSVTLGIYSS